jgi:general secretion pathway protein D
LQYLDAKPFAPLLQNILKNQRQGGTEQSKTESGQGGVERFFDEVIVIADQAETISGEQPGTSSMGSNSLIIAARNDDYARIKKLIEELDIPERQVIIEVLIADLTIQDIASLGANVRNPLNSGLPSNVNFQSSMLSTGSGNSTFLTNAVANPATIQSDLLRKAYNLNQQITQDCDPGTTNACLSAAAFFSQGTTLFSFNDAGTGQTWGIAQVRKFLDNSKVLSHPHLIATNNKEAEIVLEEQRLTRDQGSGSTGGTTTQTRKWIPAALKVIITPRISSGDIVNLKVVIDINQFEFPAADFTNVGVQSENTANRITRNVTTSANVRTGQILALGGLTRVDTTVEQLETPLLAKIPIIGWMFKNRTNTTNKNNLTVFISPTIIEPRIRGGIGAYTKNQVQLIKSYSREGMLFDNLRDPITRWFFKAQRDDAETDIDDFIAQDEFIAPTIFDVRKERRILANNTAAKPTEKITEPAKNETPQNQKTETPKDHQVLADNKAPASIPEKSLVIAAPTKTAEHNNVKPNDLKMILADIDNPFKNSTAKA